MKPIYVILFLIAVIMLAIGVSYWNNQTRSSCSCRGSNNCSRCKRGKKSLFGFLDGNNKTEQNILFDVQIVGVDPNSKKEFIVSDFNGPDVSNNQVLQKVNKNMLILAHDIYRMTNRYDPNITYHIYDRSNNMIGQGICDVQKGLSICELNMSKSSNYSLTYAY